VLGHQLLEPVVVMASHDQRVDDIADLCPSCSDSRAAVLLPLRLGRRDA
jgi:hypothetical protein